MIQKSDAEAYLAEHGHYPLLIGREYVYLDQWVRLVSASETTINVTVSTRFELWMDCNKADLGWKADRNHDVN